MRAPLGPTQHRLCLMGDGWWREIRLVVSRIAAVVPEAKSRRPATGLATVPMIPLPTPKKNPYLFEEYAGREERGGRVKRDENRGQRREGKKNTIMATSDSWTPFITLCNSW